MVSRAGHPPTTLGGKTADDFESFNSLNDSDNDRDIHIQAVIDIRRGIDPLAARSDVDASRIDYVSNYVITPTRGATNGSFRPG